MNLQEMEKNSAKAVVLLKAMANERRLQILCMLHNQELSVGELCAKLELSQSALSQHLAWLRRDELERKGTRIAAGTAIVAPRLPHERGGAHGHSFTVTHSRA